MKVILVIISFLMSVQSYSQCCEIYEIKNIPVYFYTVEREKSVSKVNDSLSFSIFAIGNQKYTVEKLFNGVIVETKKYSYTGKKRYQIFKIKKRKIDRVITVRQKKIICLLE